MTQSPLARYQAHLAANELAYQFDPETGRAVFFPRVIGPKSGNPNLEWRTSKGNGTVYSTTVNYPKEGPPYNVALIELDEGFRMMSRVEGIAPNEVRIGMKVRLQIKPAVGEDAALPVFIPTEPLA